MPRPPQLRISVAIAAALIALPILGSCMIVVPDWLINIMTPFNFFLIPGFLVAVPFGGVHDYSRALVSVSALAIDTATIHLIRYAFYGWRKRKALSLIQREPYP